MFWEMFPIKKMTNRRKIASNLVKLRNYFQKILQTSDLVYKTNIQIGSRFTKQFRNYDLQKLVRNKNDSQLRGGYTQLSSFLCPNKYLVQAFKNLRKKVFYQSFTKVTY